MTTTTGDSIWNTRMRNIHARLPRNRMRDRAKADGSERSRMRTTAQTVMTAEFPRFTRIIVFARTFA